MKFFITLAIVAALGAPVLAQANETEMATATKVAGKGKKGKHGKKAKKKEAAPAEQAPAAPAADAAAPATDAPAGQ